MNKMLLRTAALIALPAALLFVLFGVTAKWVRNAGDWAESVYNRSIFTDGVISNALIYDRNKTLLAEVKEGKIQYTQDEELREATVHCVGDRRQKIASGAVYAYSDELTGFDLLNGTVRAAEQGAELTLSLDSEINRLALRALGERSGVVAVCNYTTGELLCLASTPSFDPARSDLELDNSKRGEYLNRLTDGRYTPGSVFKLVTAAAALEQLPDVRDMTYSCEGTCIIGGNEVKCTAKHGRITLEDALAVSCNCFFAQLAVRLGAETIGEYAQRFGLTEHVYIDGIRCAAGHYNFDAHDPVQIAWSGIGQADDLINPAAMLRYISAIANGGNACELSLLLGGNDEQTALLRPETAAALSAMMNYNVRRAYDPGRFPGLPLCAKSGTAEVGGGAAPHSWFVGFLDDPEHPYAFVVVVENGGWGIQAAGSIANTILQALIERK